ncbi:hypothetical protein C8R44DRAFT_748535 [Mycena epipterygia]|nr:hypothetical protein C8R44DRAFT_748535 [Mycena epipterygia]
MLGSGAIPEIPSTVAPNATNCQGSRTFAKDKDHAYEYLTQQPPPSSELRFGSILLTQPAVFLTQLGNLDDSQTIPEIGALLSTVLPSYFGQHWGDDGCPMTEDGNSGRVMAMWTGLMGFSADEFPWIGRVPPDIARWKMSSQVPGAGLVEGGEWMCAGYSGEGMVNAWKCGDAVAQMMLGDCEYPEWLPNLYVISAERHRNAGYADILKNYG